MQRTDLVLLICMRVSIYFWSNNLICNTIWFDNSVRSDHGCVTQQVCKAVGRRSSNSGYRPLSSEFYETELKHLLIISYGSLVHLGNCSAVNKRPVWTRFILLLSHFLFYCFPIIVQLKWRHTSGWIVKVMNLYVFKGNVIVSCSCIKSLCRIRVFCFVFQSRAASDGSFSLCLILIWRSAHDPGVRNVLPTPNNLIELMFRHAHAHLRWRL